MALRHPQRPPTLGSIQTLHLWAGLVPSSKLWSLCPGAVGICLPSALGLYSAFKCPHNEIRVEVFPCVSSHSDLRTLSLLSSVSMFIHTFALCTKMPRGWQTCFAAVNPGTRVSTEIKLFYLPISSALHYTSTSRFLQQD